GRTRGESALCRRRIDQRDYSTNEEELTAEATEAVAECTEEYSPTLASAGTSASSAVKIDRGLMTVEITTRFALQSALQSVIDSDELRSVLGQINRGARVISISGLVAAPARALALAALQL